MGSEEEKRLWNVYLSGEIHSDWRGEIENFVQENQVPVRLMGPNCHHEESDQCGETILGAEESPFWKDHKAAKINSIRNRGLLKNCDLVVVKFGEKYRQWNAAFEAGQAIAMGLSLIVIHDPTLTHALKEIDSQAMAVVQTEQQVGEILKYVTKDPF